MNIKKNIDCALCNIKQIASTCCCLLNNCFIIYQMQMLCFHNIIYFPLSIYFVWTFFIFTLQRLDQIGSSLVSWENFRDHHKKNHSGSIVLWLTTIYIWICFSNYLLSFKMCLFVFPSSFLKYCFCLTWTLLYQMNK